jgi:molecular chaperone DnaJ
LAIKPGTQSGERIVVGGRGVPRLRGTGRGDLVVQVVVETPTRLAGRQEDLLRELAELRGETGSNGHGSPASRGVFGRLREAFGAS